MAAKLSDDKVNGTVGRWRSEIDRYDRWSEPWRNRGRKIIRRFRNGEPNTLRPPRFNILWSNVETIKPTLFARTPKAVVERRWRQQDEVSNFACTILQRGIEYQLSCEHDASFDSVMQSSVQDLCLPGRGTIWARYVPTIEQRGADGNPTTIDQENGPVGEDSAEGQGDASEFDPGDTGDMAEPDEADEAEGADGADDQAGASSSYEELTFEDVQFDHVDWCDFGHTVARKWQEVTAVWRAVYMTRAELRKRWPEHADKIPLEYAARDEATGRYKAGVERQAIVYEIWDKTSKQCIWLAKGYGEVLEKMPPPIKLKGFWPVPRPLYATMTNDTLEPVPDFAQYSDQADAIDDLTDRIDRVQRALRVVGVYAGDMKVMLSNVFNSADAVMIPVDNWLALVERGGIEQAIAFLPIDKVVAALTAMQASRQALIQDIYQITGMSDILRGVSDPRETAKAQGIKAQWGSTRIRDRQNDVQRFARDGVRIMGEIIAENFSPRSLCLMAGLPPEQYLPSPQQQLAMELMGVDQLAGLQQQQGSNVQPASPEQILFEKAVALLRNDALRNFAIDIETDSTIAADDAQEKQDRTEFAGMFSGAMAQMGQMAKDLPPPIAAAVAPVMGEMLLFVTRGFRAGRELESSIETMVSKIVEAAQQPPPPPQPSPHDQILAEKNQITAQGNQAKTQVEQQANAIDAFRAQTERGEALAHAVHNHATLHKPPEDGFVPGTDLPITQPPGALQ